MCTAISRIPWVDSVYPGIPWINRHSLASQLFIDCNINKTEMMINSLIQEGYIVCHLDEYYVPNRYTYRKKHYLHENLIFGFDNVKREYDILGYDRKKIFSVGKIGYNEFDQASSDNDIKFLHLRENNDFEYKLDLKFIKQLLTDYLYCRNSSNIYATFRNTNISLVYGLDVYDQLIRYIKLLPTKTVIPDIRPFHLLWEHKKCMVLRIQYLMNEYKGIIYNLEESYDEFRLIQKICYSMRNIFLKYIMTNNNNELSKIIPLLTSVKKEEQKIIPKLIKKIEVISETNIVIKGAV